MKKISVALLSGALLLNTIGVFGAEYTVSGPSAGIFGNPTSMQTVVTADAINRAAIDKSKNSALIPPTFGSPTSNLRNTGEPLTPNLASPYMEKADSGVTVSSTQPGDVPQLPSGSGTVTQQGSEVYIPGNLTYSDDLYYQEEGFTEVTDSLYYSGGYLATLKIPDIGVSVRVYEGTTNSALAKGAGHFVDTSIWNGNVCIAAHNRGTNAYFGKIHTLEYGDEITLTTQKGTRTYRVFNVEKISVNDTSNLQSTGDNIITLITCVANQADYYRWCVQGEAIN